MKIILAILMVGFTLQSCTKEKLDTDKTHSFQFTGKLKKTEVTTYMYGTHTISSEVATYALKSSTINLDAYLNQTITIKGSKINGYPVDGGPEYIEVKVVE